MPRRIFDDAIQHFQEKYKSATGLEYDPSKYRDPAAVPSHLQDIVSALKRLSAGQRQIEIIMQAGGPGTVWQVPKDKEPLIEEFKRMKAELDLWREKQV